MKGVDHENYPNEERGGCCDEPLFDPDRPPREGHLLCRNCGCEFKRLNTLPVACPLCGDCP